MLRIAAIVLVIGASLAQQGRPQRSSAISRRLGRPGTFPMAGSRRSRGRRTIPGQQIPAAACRRAAAVRYPGTAATTAPRRRGRAAAPPAQRARVSPPPANPQQPANPPQPGNPPPPQPADTPPPSDDTVVTETPTQKIPNSRAVFSGLDKITGRIISFDAAIGETVQFGALQVTARACYTRPPTEATNTDAFVDVDEVTLKGEIKRIFTGWMFASSPGLHAVEHPIYDVWLTDCSQPIQAPAPVAQSTTPSASSGGARAATPAPASGPASSRAGAGARRAGALKLILPRDAPARRRRAPADRAPARRNLPRRRARRRAVCDKPAG